MTDSLSSVFDALFTALGFALGFQNEDLFYVALLNKVTLKSSFLWSLARRVISLSE